MEAKQTNLDTISTWRDEINSYWVEMVSFEKNEDIEWILRRLSSYAARVGFMHSATVRSQNKTVMDFRTKEIDKFLAAVELQFKIWSRVAAVNQSEWGMTR